MTDKEKLTLALLVLADAAGALRNFPAFGCTVTARSLADNCRARERIADVQRRIAAA